MKITATTKSADDTRELAAALAGLVQPGDTVLLAGDLGAGKTTFTQGFGLALGAEGPITSPTFTLVRHYTEADPPLLHADVYRIEHLQEIIDLGLSELLDDGAVAVVEWGDVAAPVLAPDFLEIRIEFEGGDDERRFLFRAVGPRWAARAAAVGRALDRWTA
jgi:tRNA threonylcarbamoyladenosine biosynthesis protein TsaE